MTVGTGAHDATVRTCSSAKMIAAASSAVIPGGQTAASEPFLAPTIATSSSDACCLRLLRDPSAWPSFAFPRLGSLTGRIGISSSSESSSERSDSDSSEMIGAASLPLRRTAGGCAAAVVAGGVPRFLGAGPTRPAVSTIERANRPRAASSTWPTTPVATTARSRDNVGDADGSAKSFSSWAATSASSVDAFTNVPGARIARSRRAALSFGNDVNVGSVKASAVRSSARAERSGMVSCRNPALATPHRRPPSAGLPGLPPLVAPSV